MIRVSLEHHCTIFVEIRTMCNLYLQIANIPDCKTLKAYYFNRFFLMLLILTKNNYILYLKPINIYFIFAKLNFASELLFYLLSHIARLIVRDGPNFSMEG